jgi:hypothetical protein
MPPTNATHGLHVETTAPDILENGRYNNMNEVTQAALIHSLRNDIAQGKSSGSLVSADSVFEKLKNKYAKIKTP